MPLNTSPRKGPPRIVTAPFVIDREPVEDDPPELYSSEAKRFGRAVGFHVEHDLPVGPMLVEAEYLIGYNLDHPAWRDEWDHIPIGAWSAGPGNGCGVLLFRQVER